MIITIKFWKECVKAHQKMGRWVVRAAPAGGSPLPAHPRQCTRLPHTAATKAAWSGLHGSFLFLLRGAWRKPQQFTDLQPPGQADGGRSVCDLGCVKGCRRPVLPPSWVRETGDGEQDERWALFLPNLVTWFQRNPDFPISSLNQVWWTKCKY